MATPEATAQAAHEGGLRAANAGRLVAAASTLRGGLAALGWREEEGADAGDLAPAHRALAARLLASLALVESEQGRATYGLACWTRPRSSPRPATGGYCSSSAARCGCATGRWEAAIAQFTTALPLLGTDAERLSITLLNRAVAHLNTGDLRHARNDLRRAQAIATESGLGLTAAKAAQNIGYCDLLTGDIPAALHGFDVAAATYQRIAPGHDAGPGDRSLARAAGRGPGRGRHFQPGQRHRRLPPAAPRSVLRRSRAGPGQAAIAVGDLTAARRWSLAAIRRFRARGNHAWAALAELTRLRANLGDATDCGGTGKPRAHNPARLAAQAEQLASRLRGHHLRGDATLASLIAARALIAAGRLDAAAGQLAAVSGRGLPLDIALLRRVARAELAARSGNKGNVLAELRAGLASLHDRRGQLGSLDLQTGAAALGTQLADMGLRCVLDHGSARQVFAWMERSRAQAFRVKPVRPPDDPEEAALLAELRQLAILIRTAELNGRPDARAAARRAELQRRVRQRRWRSSGAGTAIGVVTPAQVGDALAASGQVLAALLARDNDLLAVTIRGHQVKLVTLGDFARATEATRKLTADLDALAGRSLPARLEAVIRDSIENQTAILEAEVIAPLQPLLGDDGLVLIPTGPLAGVPWSMLPSLRARPVTVSPSATHWLATWRRLAGEALQPPVPPAPRWWPALAWPSRFPRSPSWRWCTPVPARSPATTRPWRRR